MRRRFLGGAGALLALAWAVLTPGSAQAQPDATGYSPPAWQSPLPIYSTRPEEGLFTSASFLYYRQGIPLEDQKVAWRGFIDVDGSITGTSGTVVTNGNVALDTGKVDGPTNYQPGVQISIGYRFSDGSSLEYNWFYLHHARYAAVATLVPPNLRGGAQLEETFLFSPVYNFPIDFSGPSNDIVGGTGAATYGVWNGADQMTLEFIQRNQIHEFRYRIPMYETECWRTYGMIGPRFVWFWERFRWKSLDADLDGVTAEQNTGIYNNVISNRMYGLFCGIGNEWYMGNGLAVSLDLEAAGLLNIVRKIAEYKRGDRFTGPRNRRSRTDYTIVPEFRGMASLWWYPIEGVQMRIGYDMMLFLNTVASPNPVEFNYGAMTPEYDRKARLMDGFQVGLAISF